MKSSYSREKDQLQVDGRRKTHAAHPNNNNPPTARCETPLGCVKGPGVEERG